MARLFLLICLICLNRSLSAQVSLYIDGKKSLVQKPANQDLRDFGRRKVTELLQDGFLFAAIDSIISDGEEIIYLHRGVREEVIVDDLKIIGINLLKSDYKRVRSPIDILEDYISNGYPFAGISWEDLQQDRKGRLHGKLLIDPGPFVVNDTLALLTSVKTRPAYIQQTIGLEIGKPFNELAYRSIANKLERIEFLELRSPPDIAFSGGQAITYLNLEERQASTFEGIIGLLPNQAASNKMLITGYIDLNLANLFNAGKQLQLNWQQFAASSQQLTIDYDHAYFLRSNVLLRGGFNLIKQDTTFITRNLQLDVGSFLFGSNIRIDGSYERLTGDLISSNTELITREGLADFSTDNYSISLGNQGRTNRFDDYINFEFKTSLGKKTIGRNATLPPEFYDSLSLVSTIFQFRSNLQWQKIIFNRTAFFQDNRLGVMENAQLFRNELYRIGGLKSLRGFNENFFFTQNYLLSRLELRQYFEERSYILLFYDQAIMNNFAEWSYLMGFGLGLTLDTGNGLFNFVLALGRSEEIALDINNAKIHLGYTSRF